MGNDATITAAWADTQIKIEGEMGDNCWVTTEKGNITTGKIGNKCTVKADKGNILAKDVGVNCLLQTSKKECNITAGEIGTNTRIKTKKGIVSVESLPPRCSASEVITAKKIYINGALFQEEKKKSKYTCTYQFAGVSTGRIVILMVMWISTLIT